MFWLRNKTINYLVRNHYQRSDTCHCKFIFTYRFVQDKFLYRSFNNKLFFSIMTASPALDQSCHFIWCVKCKTNTVCKRISLIRGESISVKLFFYILYIEKQKQSFQAIILIGTCLMRKKTLLRIVLDIIPCNKIDKPLTVYRFGKVT